MNTYYLRCRKSQLETLISRGIRMGVIQEQDGTISPVGAGAWDDIGLKYSSVVDGEPLGEPVGGSDDPYWHINFRTVHNLREKAVEAAMSGDSDIASGLQEIANYFITDAEGNATAPQFPLRVFL